jgi:hypothetical protein
MQPTLDLLEETISHFNEGARSVRAYANETTYIFTRVSGSSDFYVTLEEPGFPKTRVTSIEGYFPEVFGIEVLH